MEYLTQITSVAFAWLLTATLYLSLLTPKEINMAIQPVDEVQTTLTNCGEELNQGETTVSRCWKPTANFPYVVYKNWRGQKETALLSNTYPRYLRFRPLLI